MGEMTAWVVRGELIHIYSESSARLTYEHARNIDGKVKELPGDAIAVMHVTSDNGVLCAILVGITWRLCGLHVEVLYL